MARLECDDCGYDPTILEPQCEKKCDCNAHEHKFDLYIYDGGEVYTMKHKEEIEK